MIDLLNQDLNRMYPNHAPHLMRFLDGSGFKSADVVFYCIALALNYEVIYNLFTITKGLTHYATVTDNAQGIYFAFKKEQTND